jgi:hypothetical protein
MAQKPANQNLSQAIPNLIDSAGLESLYEAHMDSLLSSIGRDVTFYLPPAITESNSNKEMFNPWTRSKDPRTSTASEAGDGVSVEPIYVVYKAHVVHGPKAVSDGVPFQLDVGDIQFTTVIGSSLDIEKAVEAHIDGMKFDIKKLSPRPIGLTTPKYLITVWTKKAGS